MSSPPPENLLGNVKWSRTHVTEILRRIRDREDGTKFYLKKIEKNVSELLKEEKDVAKNSEIPKYNKTYTQVYPSQN